MDRDALGVTIADIKDAGPECAEPSLDSGRRKEWKRATGWARGWLIDSSLASELLLAGIDINVPRLDLLVDTQAIRTGSARCSFPKVSRTRIGIANGNRNRFDPSEAVRTSRK
jgi:hypothetical protein